MKILNSLILFGFTLGCSQRPTTRRSLGSRTTESEEAVDRVGLDQAFEQNGEEEKNGKPFNSIYDL